MTNLVPQARLVSQRLNVPVNSPAWPKGGMNARPADTGGHEAYGHYHAHYWVGDAWKAMLCNALDRPDIFTDEPTRDVSYEYAGRPSWWRHKEPPVWVTGSDGKPFPTGAVFIDGVPVYGRESSHFHLSFLFLVMDKGSGLPVWTPLEPVVKLDAADVARILVRLSIAQLAGMFRTHGTYILPDRPVACMLRAVTGALERDVLDPDVPADAADRDVLLKYLDLILDRWLGPRVADDNNQQQSGHWSGAVPNRPFAWQVYNGPYWRIPAIKRLLPHLDFTRKQRALEVLKRDCELVRQLWKLNALGCAGISFPTEQCNKVHLNYDWLTLANVHYTGDDWTTWAIHPLDIAGLMFGSSAMRIRARELGEACSDKRWAVDAEGVPFGVAVGPKP